MATTLTDDFDSAPIDRREWTVEPPAPNYHVVGADGMAHFYVAKDGAITRLATFGSSWRIPAPPPRHWLTGQELS